MDMMQEPSYYFLRLIFAPLHALYDLLRALPPPPTDIIKMLPPPPFYSGKGFDIPRSEAVREQPVITKGRMPTPYKGEEPLGRLEQYDFTLTDSKIQQIRYLTPAWYSVTLINDGPGEIDIYLNDNNESKPIRAKSGEAPNIDFKKPALKKLYVRLATGNSASGRAIGKY